MAALAIIDDFERLRLHLKQSTWQCKLNKLIEYVFVFAFGLFIQ